jgi:hypothetical protein
MPFMSSVEGRYAYGRPNPTTGGSLRFTASSTSGISIPNDVDFQIGTGDFTIEWFQYGLTGSNSAPRIFSIGSYSSASIAVSQEGSDSSRTFYAWVSGANSMATSINILNRWIHYAITRSGTSLRVFQDGIQIGSTLTNSTNFNNTTQALRLGNETTPSTAAAFNGYITNFHWVKGTALYTGNFTKPSGPISPVANTKLLLLATTSATAFTDSSGKGKASTQSGVAWNSLTPF